ncbi:MAG TPA: hypothetical protein VMT87_17205 [Vicinamibacteria bacterium]|nr:hypothetical protein [Vicinamibacteria bacterium]
MRARLGKTGSLFLTALLSVVAPTVVSAEGSATATLYEVMEAAPPRPSTDGMAGVFIPGPGGSITRLAQATLSGSCNESAAGALVGWANAAMEAHAQSRINMFTGSGPFSAGFTLDGTANGSTPGKASGTLDMSAMLDPSNPLPWAFVSATWRTLGDPSTRLSGPVAGLAYVPIACPHDGAKACYLDRDWSVTELGAQEYKDGIPLVKFVLEFVVE